MREILAGFAAEDFGFVQGVFQAGTVDNIDFVGCLGADDPRQFRRRPSFWKKTLLVTVQYFLRRVEDRLDDVGVGVLGADFRQVRPDVAAFPVAM